jgi:SPP1 gp7 family putative phage head morphogenesis protein
MALAQLVEQSTRHQVYLERLKSSEANQWVSFLQEIDRSLRERLSGNEISEFSRRRLEKLVREVDAMLAEIYSRYQEQLKVHLVDLAEYEAGFEARSLNSAIKGESDFEFIVPAASQVNAAILSHPLSVRGADGGKLLEPFIKDWTATERKRVSNAIRQGFFEGQSNSQLLQVIRGTRANKFQDGILAVNDRHVRTMVRTAVQHVASVSRLETLKANDDVVESYDFIATLDGRTTVQCRALDGQNFQIGQGPLPPLHPGCRSTIVPRLSPEFDFLNEGATRSSKDGYVDANQTYYQWLKKQPKDFQDDAIGPPRAQLLRDGGLTEKEFARLSLGRNFKPLTLEEMKLKEPNAFARAGL